MASRNHRFASRIVDRVRSGPGSEAGHPGASPEAGRPDAGPEARYADAGPETGHSGAPRPTSRRAGCPIGNGGDRDKHSGNHAARHPC
jgi:hypothetical protein